MTHEDNLLLDLGKILDANEYSSIQKIALLKSKVKAWKRQKHEEWKKDMIDRLKGASSRRKIHPLLLKQAWELIEKDEEFDLVWSNGREQYYAMISRDHWK